MEKKAIIIGATSGIGKALAELLAQQNYTLGLTGRREHLLKKLANNLPTKVFIKTFDVKQITKAQQCFNELLTEMQKVDLVIISAGTGHVNPNLDTSLDLETIDTNVRGFVTIANSAFQYFQRQKAGHLIGISSITAVRGNSYAPVYSASKAFISNYLEGLRLKTMKTAHNITISDIKPGFVDTAMGQDPRRFWVATPHKAARQIVEVIDKKKFHAYITKRWRIIAWLMKLIPARLYYKFS